jgi:hypothetical protein
VILLTILILGEVILVGAFVYVLIFGMPFG